MYIIVKFFETNTQIKTKENTINNQYNFFLIKFTLKCLHL